VILGGDDVGVHDALELNLIAGGGILIIVSKKDFLCTDFFYSFWICILEIK
jgi:hypothetical protein